MNPKGAKVAGAGVLALYLMSAGPVRAQVAGDSGTEPEYLAQGNPPAQPKPPAGTPAAPLLGDLGFSPDQTTGSAKDQARLDKRSHMLRVHQRLGLITTGPLLATVISGSFAGGRSTSSTSRDLHAALGSATAGLYFTTAYYSIFAPRVPGTVSRGPIRLHETLAWIHGPGTWAFWGHGSPIVCDCRWSRPGIRICRSTQPGDWTGCSPGCRQDCVRRSPPPRSATRWTLCYLSIGWPGSSWRRTRIWSIYCASARKDPRRSCLTAWTWRYSVPSAVTGRMVCLASATWAD